MRIDLSWGSDRSRVKHPIAELAMLALGRLVAARSYGPGLTWLDVLFVEPRGKTPKTAKAQWRWRGTFAQHVIVEVAAPALETANRDDAVRALIEAVIPAIERARPLLDPALRFDAAALTQHLRTGLGSGSLTKALREIVAQRAAEHVRRRVALEYGDEATRREWIRPLSTPLQWVRLFPGAIAGVPRRTLAREAALVAALIASALHQRLSTPGYREIYINVGDDADAMRREPAAVEDWHENAYALVTASRVCGAKQHALRRVLFEASRRALIELAAVDHLDAGAIRSLLDAVDVEELRTPFVYRRLESATHVAEIVYRFSERDDAGAVLRPIHHLVATSIASGREARWSLGPIDPWESRRALKGFELRGTDVRITVAQDRRSKALRFALPE
jgi:hypothetical protein